MPKLSLEPPVYKVGDLYFSPTSGVIDNQGDLSLLRAREANLFNELIKTFPEVLSRTTIEETLWKDSYATNATINQTVKALRFSLQDVDRTLIRTIPKQGYVLAIAPIKENGYGDLSPCFTSPNEQVTEEIDTNKSSSEDSNQPIHSIRVVVAVCTIAIASFALSASGLFVSEPNRVSQKYGNHWVLFEPTENELSSLPVKPDETTKYITKHANYYRICSEKQGVLECQKVDF
ncbi:winged helix-turn-helix domain-containing protein [Vibrio alfacsensis]|uniref:winged helix-turn-helix domain-containing protein n=1 Tax=Vibrio alfacsensis TaxID=1074311 RepID=UPI002ADE7DFB|nr:winged helix-turn-helix domain-containing protein [Vibrio alfacsensis]WQE77426.1 winged helix-turn-helix domain-containing protein [Vibrio alfacsensis]